MNDDKKIADKLRRVTGNEEFNNGPINNKKLPDDFYSPPPPPPKKVKE